LKKYGIETCDPLDTLMVEKSTLDEDPQGKAVDPTRYRGMIGTLMYLTSIIPLGVEEADHDIEVAHMDNTLYVDFLIPKPSSEESSSRVVMSNNVHLVNQTPEHINKWTKDHPLDNVIGDPSRPDSFHQGGDKRFAWSARVQGGDKEASMVVTRCRGWLLG
ncbi:hypothetical protein Tco_1260247, partial [Tanacetum coccineum]